MAPLKLVVLSLMIMLVSSKGQGPTISDLMGAMETSMQNTISLTALVGQQTKDIKEITNLVDNAQKEIEDLKSKLTTSEEKSGKEIEALKNNSSTLEGQLAASERKLAALKESMEDEHEASETMFEAVQNNTSILDGKLEALRESMEDEHEASETKFTQEILALQKSIQDSNKEVEIISADGGLRNASCVRTCSGATGKGSTSWSHHSSTWVSTKIDMSKCGFVMVPSITTGFDVENFNTVDSYSLLVYGKAADYFKLQITSAKGHGAHAESQKWNVNWIAVGYTC